MQRKYFALGLAAGIIIGLVAGLFIPQFLPQFIKSGFSGPQSDSTRVTVVEGQIANITFENNRYAFTYQPANTNYGINQGASFTVITPLNFILPPQYDDAIVGKVYVVSGIEIVVSEVHNNYIVLDVKSTSLNPGSVTESIFDFKVIDVYQGGQNPNLGNNPIILKNMTDFEECVRLLQGSNAVVFRAILYASSPGQAPSGWIYFFPHQGTFIVYYDYEPAGSSFTRFEQLKFTNAYATSPSSVIFTIKNTGTATATVMSTVLINGIPGGTITWATGSEILNPGDSSSGTIALPIGLKSGETVEIKLQTTSGNQYPQVIVLP